MSCFLITQYSTDCKKKSFTLQKLLSLPHLLGEGSFAFLCRLPDAAAAFSGVVAVIDHLHTIFFI